LVFVQSGIITVIGALLKDTVNRRARIAALLSVLALVTSVIAAANVLGSLPIIAERASSIGQRSIYDQAGNLGIRLATNCTIQVVFFICGLARSGGKSCTD
jgi:ferric-dicitrate binding protein FerR (iron transport regulator)